MTKKGQIKAVVSDGYLSSDDLPAPLSLSSPYWISWLENHRKFRYECHAGRFTAYRIDRGWAGQKRVDGRLRQKWLGTSSRLAKRSNRDLGMIAIALNSPSYWDDRDRASREWLNARIDQLESEIEGLRWEYSQLNRAYEEATGKSSHMTEKGI